MASGSHVGRWSCVSPPRGPYAALGVKGCSSNLEVEALSRQVMAAVIGVRVAEAIVACLKEAHESFWVATTRKISTSPFIFS
jgi:hypothetical protein